MRYLPLLLLAFVALAIPIAEKRAALKPGRLRLHDKDDWIRAIAFSPDGKTIAAGTSKNRIVLWDLGNGKEISRGVVEKQVEGRYVHSVVFSADGKKLAMVCESSNIEPEPAGIQVWEVGPNRQVKPAKTFRNGRRRSDSALWQVAFSRDGKLLATADGEGTIRLWKVATGDERLRFHGGDAAFFSPDGRSMVSVSHDGLIHLWAAGTNRPLNPERKAQRTDFIHVERAVFAPSGRLVALSDGFNTWLKDVTTGRTLRRLEFPFSVTPVAFSPDDRTLSAYAQEGTCLFDTTTGKELAWLDGNGVGAFSPDGRVFAYSDGRSIFLEDMPVRRPESIKPQPASDPPDVPLEAELVATRDSYVLDLGGLTAEEFSDEAHHDYAPVPLVDLVLKLRNKSAKPVTIHQGLLELTSPTFYLAGVGALNIPLGTVQTGIGPLGDLPKPIILAPKACHCVHMKTLGDRDRSYWVLPGEYTLHAHCHGAISPAPKGATDAGGGFGYIALRCPPIKLKVLPAARVTLDPLEKFSKVPPLGALVAAKDPEGFKILDLLSKPVNFDEFKGPLQDVVIYLSDRYEIDVHIDEAAFKKRGKEGIAEAITQCDNFEQVSFNLVLQMLLEPLDADLEVEKNALRIVPLARPKPLAERLRAPNGIYRGHLYDPVDFKPGIAKGTPLATALQDLGERFHLTIFVDRKAFEKAGIKDVDKRPVQLGEQADVRPSSVLRQLLRQAGATIVERENLVLVVPIGK